MNFFLIYLCVIAGLLSHTLLLLGFRFLFVKYQVYKFEKKVKNGEIKMMSMEQLQQMMGQSQGLDEFGLPTKKDKKTWN